MANIFTLFSEKHSDTGWEERSYRGRSVRYATIGFFLGVAAPVGWLLLRLLLFYDEQQGLWQQSLGRMSADPEQLILFIYMGVGTALVLASFAYFIGRAAEQIQLRALRLKEMNSTIASQKEEYQQKYKDLNARITNYQTISGRIQKTMDLEELISLTGHALSEVIDYDRVNLLTVNHEQKELRLAVSISDGTSVDTSSTLPMDERAGVLFKAVIDQRHYLVNELHLMPADFKMKPPCDSIEALRSKSFLVCPVVVSGVTEMILAVDNKSTGRPLSDADADTLKLFAAQVAASILRLRLFSAVDSLTRELERTFSQLMGYRHDYQMLLKTLKQNIDSSVKLVGEIGNSTDVVRDAVNSTQSTSMQISSSIDEVENNIKQLSGFMDKSISAMTEIAATIREVDNNSISSHQMSEQVLEHAEGGAEAVKETLAGLDGISKGVAKTVETIYHLSLHGEEISTITTVITEIAQKTNLLALNAAIIAAQAGEQGRSFAVVAEEIRELSQKTAHSSGAIDKLIQDMNSRTSDVVAQVADVEALVVQGSSLGSKTEQALEQILSSATSAKDMTRNIRHATREVSRSAEFVTQSIEDLGEMTEQVSTAMREQSQGGHGIVRAIEDIRDMADAVANVAIQQRQDSLDMEAAVESVAEMAERIFSEMDARSAQSRSVINQLQQFRETD